MDHPSRNLVFPSLFILIAGVHCTGLPIPVMEVDAAQYASISAEMVRTGKYLEVHHRGWDYLDKPPLLFWLAAFFMKVLGVGTLAYKLPTYIVLALGTYAVYGYTRLFHPIAVARIAAVVFGSSLALLLMTNDCRTDGLLIGFCAVAVWKLAAYILGRRLPDLLLGSLGVGLAMLSKGPLGLVFPVLMVAPLVWRHRREQGLAWVLAIPVIALVLLPMCLGLYRQHGMEGLRFFFWTQSFGRITGESEWANDADPFLLGHTLLWCFLPWTVFLLSALGSELRSLFKGSRIVPEHGSFTGFVLVLVALSLSRYKLPHYAYIACLPAAVITARRVAVGMQGAWLAAHWMVLALLILVVTTATALLHGTFPWGMAVLLAAGLLVFLVPRSRGTSGHRDLVLTVVVWAVMGLQIDLFFYPALLRYQASSEAALLIREHGLADRPVHGFHWHDHALSFYLDRDIPFLSEVGSVEALPAGDLIYTDEAGLRSLDEGGIAFRPVGSVERYEVQNLELRFLDPRTRADVLEQRYIVELIDR